MVNPKNESVSSKFFSKEIKEEMPSFPITRNDKSIIKAQSNMTQMVSAI